MDNQKPLGKKHILISSFLILLIIVGMVVGLFAAGCLAVLRKQPKQQVVLLTRICGDDIVATYNKVSQFKETSSSEGFAIDEVGLKNLSSQIKGIKNYQNDPTCQTILLQTAIHDKDFNAAKAAYAAVKNLHAKQMYADSNLNTGGSLSSYGSLVQELSPSNQGNESQEPKGGA